MDTFQWLENQLCINSMHISEVLGICRWATVLQCRPRWARAQAATLAQLGETWRMTSASWMPAKLPMLHPPLQVGLLLWLWQLASPRSLEAQVSLSLTSVVIYASTYQASQHV